MSDVKMSDENVIYCLNYLSEFDAKDIEDDEFDISVNDDQFASMSIVRTAKLGAELAEKLTEQVKTLREFAKSLNLSGADDIRRMILLDDMK